MGLPFFTVLAPSRLLYDGKPRSPKTLLDCARQAALQIHGWLPGRRIAIAAATSADQFYLALIRRAAGSGMVDSPQCSTAASGTVIPSAPAARQAIAPLRAGNSLNRAQWWRVL